MNRIITLSVTIVGNQHLQYIVKHSTVQWCRKQIRSGEAIGSSYGSNNIKCMCKVRTYEGGLGTCPPGKFLIFSTSEVVSEPLSANIAKHSLT